jgi:hypothetical protein
MNGKLIRFCALAIAVFLTLTLTAFAAEWTNASDWAVGELEKASETKLIPESLDGKDFKAQITRAEFAAVAVKLYEAIAGAEAETVEQNPFTDTSDVGVLKAYGLGIVNGITENTFAPDDLLDREQAAAMLTRAMSKAIPDIKLVADGAPEFADAADISAWAKDSVLYMARRKIIGGFPDKTFRPRNKTEAMKKAFYANATREQAVIMALRCYDASKIPDNVGIELS